MTGFIANARMYAVTPAVEAIWRTLIAAVAEAAHVPLRYEAYPAPRPLEALWTRPDLGCVFMCGYPIASRMADVVPIAAPIPDAAWAAGEPLYRTDFIVRADSRFTTLADTFGGRFGWTVRHSQSGFNAPRHHLLRYRKAGRPTVFEHVARDLVTARRVLDSVIDGSIDVGPLDAYWHVLMRAHAPGLAAKVRVIESSEATPTPALVASPHMPAEAIVRLRQGFAEAHRAHWFPPVGAALRLQGFTPVGRDDYAVTLAWEREAVEAGYPAPE